MAISEFFQVSLSPADTQRTYPGTVDDFQHETGRDLARAYAASAASPAWQPHYDLQGRFHMRVETETGPGFWLQIDCLCMHQNDQMAARNFVFAPTDSAADVRARCIQFRMAPACEQDGNGLAFKDVMRVSDIDVFSGCDWKMMGLRYLESELANFLALHGRYLYRQYQDMCAAAPRTNGVVPVI